MSIFSDRFEDNNENDDFEDETAEDIVNNVCSVADDEYADGLILFKVE